MLYTSKLFLTFIFFSFIGWIWEVIYFLVTERKFINRGFMIGPMCPIYGAGGLLIVLLLKKYMDDPVILFILTMLLCSVLEYYASYFIEKIFKIRWWDYSDKKFNINGRIYLLGALAFGTLGMVAIYFVFPAIMKFLGRFNPKVIYIVSTFLLIVFIVDLVQSIFIARKFKITAKNLKGDSTEKIVKFKETIFNTSVLTKRLYESFPKLIIKFDLLEKKKQKKP